MGLLFENNPVFTSMQAEIQRIKQEWSGISESEKVLLFQKVISSSSLVKIEPIFPQHYYPFHLLLLGIDEIPREALVHQNPEYLRLYGFIKAQLSKVEQDTILSMRTYSIFLPFNMFLNETRSTILHQIHLQW